MKRFILLLLAFVCMISVSACGNEAVEESNTAESICEASNEANISTSSEEESMENKTFNILFIGNSYTYYSDMPEKIFEPMAKSAGFDFKVDSLTKGGWYLIDSASSTDELGRLIDGALKKTKYDYVVLQEQSTCPALNPGKFYDGVRRLTDKIKENGATPILYGTWGRKTGSATLPNLGWTHESMTWKIAAAYEAIGDELDIDVAHVGFAFHDVYTNSASVTDVYADDLTHPSYSGSYLAAITIFAKITNTDPTEIDFNGELLGNVTSVLKEAARKAVFETPEIPAAYKTESNGITFTE